MKSVAFLHIGDIHYPDLRTESPHADIKDEGLNSWFLQRLTPNRVIRVSEALLTLLYEDPAIRAVLLSGDLTNRGDLDGYRDCVTYLVNALDLKNAVLWDKRAFHVVPGNDDVYRKDVDKTGNDVFKKFREIEKAWESSYARVLEASEVRAYIENAAIFLLLWHT